MCESRHDGCGGGGDTANRPSPSADRATEAVGSEMVERAGSDEGLVEPGIDYSLSALKGRWAYMNDEGTSQIHKGYRLGLSFGQCVYSMFQIHNETINIWSHVCGCLLFAFLCVSLLSSPPRLTGSHGGGHPALPPPVCRLGGPNGTGPGGVGPFNESGGCPVSSGAGRNESRAVEERHAWTLSLRHFEAAKHMLASAGARLPGLRDLTEAVGEKTSHLSEEVRKEVAATWEKTSHLSEGVRKEVAATSQRARAEARALEEKLRESVAALEWSVEQIREELAHLSHASMEGCVTCWADVVARLAISRSALDERLAAFHSMTAGAAQAGHKWGARTAEWAEQTAAEVRGMGHSLNVGIKEARHALQHASQHMTEELQHELRLATWEILPHKDAGLTRWPIVVFLLSACVCLMTSALYHLFNCHSRALNDALLLLDYVGISVLIAGSFFPPIFYGFFCSPNLLKFYLCAVSVISVSSAVVGVYSGLNPSVFWRWARVLCYSANACFGMLPCGHLALRWVAGEQSWGPAIAYITAMLSIYGLGTCIYTFQFPEKYFPGRFDYFLSSHQLWHILVFSAAFLHYFCAIGHYEWRAHHVCPGPGMSVL